MNKRSICFIAQFPPPIHGLSKAVETVYYSNLNDKVNSDSNFEFEKIDIKNNKDFFKNMVKISKSKADLFYFTISQTKGGNLRDLMILKLLEIQKKQCLVHLHGGYYRQLIDNDLSVWQRKENYRAIKKISGAIVLSNSLKKIFDGMLDNEKVFVVENGVDNQYLLSDKEITEKISNLEKKEILHILWLSNFIRSKGYVYVLEMAKEEKKRVDLGGKRRFHFDFAGMFFDDGERDFFVKYVKKNNLEDYVTYHGIVSGEKKKKLLKESYIFSLPTRYPKEGQPISILEAMGNGMYIVTTDHAGIPDIIKDGINGIVIKKDQDVKKTIDILLKEKNFKEKCFFNREQVVRQYTQKMYINKIKEVYQVVLKEKFTDETMGQ